LESVSRICAFALSLAAAGCASFDGRGLTPGQSNAAEVERVMGTPAEKRQVGAETWYFYSRQPYGRVTYVARVGADGRLVGLEQRLTDANVAKIVPNATRAQDVRDLLGPPWTAVQYAQLDRNVWTWWMRRYGDPGMPGELVVQMSPDGVVREVYFLQQGTANRGSGSS
jgi:outer membrane protein assembly factor BamE (lipoprotein component of BamABCDE complex)